MNGNRRFCRRQVLALLVASSFMLTGCDAGAGSDGTPTREGSATATEVVVPATEVATGTASATPDGGPWSWELPRDGRSAGVLLAWRAPLEDWDEERGRRGDTVLLPLDAATGETLPGYEPVELRKPLVRGVSPDGRRLALITRGGSPGGSPGVVRLLDLMPYVDGGKGPPVVLAEATPVERWEVVSETLEDPLDLHSVRWSADGELLYGIKESYSGRPATVWVLMPELGTAEVLTALENHPWSVPLLSSDGSLYAPRHRGSQCCGIEVEGEPFLVVLDLASGEVRGEIELPGLAMGQGFETLFEGQDEYNILRDPALAISPDGSTIYVVHAEEDRITVVDTERMVAAAPVEIGRPRSALAEFGSWLLERFAGRAEAKGGIYRTKVAEVSADGRWLYVSGQRDVACADQPHFRCANEPVGLQVVELATMELVHEEPEVSRFAVSPDGRRLLGWGSMHDTRDDPPGDDEVEGVTTGFGLKILDAETFELVAHVAVAQVVRQVTASPDGRYGYFLTDGPGLPTEPGGRCSEDCTLLSVVDLESGDVTRTRMFDTVHVSLVGLAPS